jgi:hypothetical protein
MVRGRGVNPSYRFVPWAREQGSTFFEFVGVVATLYPEAVGYADSSIHELTGCSWRIEVQRYGDSALKLGILRTVGNIRTDASMPIYSTTPSGSILARMRTRGIMRTAA